MTSRLVFARVRSFADGKRGASRRLRRGERGAALVEAALIVPLLMSISLAVFDLGIGFKTSLTVSNAVRAGARTATNLGTDEAADQAALAGVAAALGTVASSDIDVVVIYKATSQDGDVPAACLTSSAKAAGGDATAQCNVYSATDLAQAQTSTAFTGNCTSSRDHFWCPSSRGNSQIPSAGPDLVGVYIRVNHTTVTKVFGTKMEITDHAAMRVEPNAGN